MTLKQFFLFPLLLTLFFSSAVFCEAPQENTEINIDIGTQASTEELKKALNDKSLTTLKLSCYGNERNKSIIDANIKTLTAELKETNIETLEIEGHHIDGGIGDKNVKLLATGLKGSKVIKLSLPLYNMQAQGAEQLVKKLKETAVTDLNLSLNQISVHGIIQVAQALQNTNVISLHMVVDLDEFDGDSATKLGTTLNNTKISSLFLDIGGLNDAKTVDANGAKLHAILKGIKLKKLQFWLSSSIHNQTPNGISDTGAQVLGKALKGLSFMTLSFENNYLNDVGIVTLARELKETKFSILDVSHNQITIEGAVNLFTELKDMQEIEINLSQNQISIEDQGKLKKGQVYP